jgi:hypothetical protein
MIIVLADDACLYAYPSIAAVTLQIEGLDADTIRVAFDEDGQRYRIQWIEPNDDGTGRFLEFVGSGVYTLVPDGEPNLNALHALIDLVERNGGQIAPEILALRNRFPPRL